MAAGGSSSPFRPGRDQPSTRTPDVALEPMPASGRWLEAGDERGPRALRQSLTARGEHEQPLDGKHHHPRGSSNAPAWANPTTDLPQAKSNAAVMCYYRA